MEKSIAYRAGYKYQLEYNYYLFTPLRPASNIITKYIHLTLSGFMIIQNGYAWDGPSGPTLDTADFMRGSLVHDACYQLIHEGYLTMADKDIADKLLRDICIEDGMSHIRAEVVYTAVRLLGRAYMEFSGNNPLQYAPHTPHALVPDAPTPENLT